MVFFFIVVLCCMGHHIWDVTNITDIYAKRVTWNMGLPTLVNYLTIVANCIGFGKPYSIAYAASEYPDRTSTIVNDLIRRKNGRSLS